MNEQDRTEAAAAVAWLEGQDLTPWRMIPEQEVMTALVTPGKLMVSLKDDHPPRCECHWDAGEQEIVRVDVPDHQTTYEEVFR